MLKGLRSAETAMNIHMNRTSVLANNLANVGSVGFKQVLTQVVENGPATTPDIPEGDGDRLTLTALNPRDSILSVRAPIDMTQGVLRETGDATDVALQSEGFFKVSQDGRDYYTRNGDFGLNAQRQLVTGNGALVQGSGGPVSIPEGEFLITETGGIEVNGAEVGALAVMKFEDTGYLRQVGGSLFSAPEDLPAQAVPREQIRMAQGMLEESNANPIDTMVAMIAAQRAFELESKVLQASDRTLDKAVNELSRKA